MDRPSPSRWVITERIGTFFRLAGMRGWFTGSERHTRSGAVVKVKNPFGATKKKRRPEAAKKLRKMERES